ncbi:unnamed protein product [Penicillium olsonii]|uniref:Serine/threonine-protein kinase ATG1 n=1 Tax=Penicillium olsonii TaxID=99116 RepID=A0A9W4HFU5_PENOL|nr:unnamed protein product [Penicillium olsonii]CAG8036961.1 unnamed protein product [Penicillium olsonii]
MSRIPDIVRDFKLRTQFQDGNAETIHTYHESDLAAGRRVVVRLEHWQRQREIGSGSYGQVWLEKCTKGGRTVNVRAVKQVPTNGHIDYHRELEAITRFSHKNYYRCFTTSFGWFETPTHLFIAMEYLERGDLLAYLKGRPPLPESETKVIASQIVEAIAMMHENGFRHGDLKPNNILIMSHPPHIWWVKLTDFGLSKRIEEASGASTLLKGTPGFIAPELYELTERGTPYAPDLWAVGATLFFMLVKRHVFDSVGQLARYATNSKDFPTNLLIDVGATRLAITFIKSLMFVEPRHRATADIAFQHEWLQSGSSLPIGEAGPDSLFKSPPLSNGSVIDLSTEEYAPWDTGASHDTSSDTLEKGHHYQTSSNSNEEWNITAERAAIGQFGGKLRVAKELVHPEWRDAIAFSADSKILAVAGPNDPIELWDLSSHSKLPGLKGKLCIAFSPDGKLFASCGIDFHLHLWDAATWAELDYSNLTRYPQSIIFSPDSKKVACYANGTVAIRDVATGSKLRKFRFMFGAGGYLPRAHLAFSFDSKRILLTWANVLEAMDIDQGEWKGSFNLPTGSHALGFSPDGHHMAYTTRTMKTCIMELTTRSVTLEIDTNHTPLGVAFSHKAELFAIFLNEGGSHGGTLSLWDLRAKGKLSTTTYSSRMRSMVFSPDGRMIACTNWDGPTTIWIAGEPW